MNKTNKIFMTAVAGLTAVQGVNGGVTKPIFATETTDSTIQESKKTSTTQEDLEQQITDAQNNVTALTSYDFYTSMNNE